MTLDPITNNVSASQDRMVVQWKNKENEDKILKIRANRIQILEDTLNQIINERAISTASGLQLDGLGENYGDQGDRENRNDEQYKAFLQVLPAKLRQAGQHEVLIQALKNLTSAIRIEHEYFYPRALALYAVLDDVDSLTNEDEINNEMQAIRAQGVRLDIGLMASSESFVFADNTNGDVPLNSGFATLSDGSDGGKFIKLIG